jgi:hypothetical protein
MLCLQQQRMRQRPGRAFAVSSYKDTRRPCLAQLDDQHTRTGSHACRGRAGGQYRASLVGVAAACVLERPCARDAVDQPGAAADRALGAVPERAKAALGAVSIRACNFVHVRQIRSVQVCACAFDRFDGAKLLATSHADVHNGCCWRFSGLPCMAGQGHTYPGWRCP